MPDGSSVRKIAQTNHIYPLGDMARHVAVQFLFLVTLGIGVVLQAPTIILVPLAAWFGFRLRAGSAELEYANLIFALRRQRTRVIELENKLASARGL